MKFTPVQKPLIPQYAHKDIPLIVLTGFLFIVLTLTISILRSQRSNTNVNAQLADNFLEPENGAANGNISIVSNIDASGGRYALLGSAAISPTVGARDLSDGAVVWTGINGNSYYVDRTTNPVKDYSIQELSENEFRFKVINGDLAASTTRERSELVGRDNYTWGTDIWVNMERIIDHYAAGVHDVIAGQFHDVPNSGLGPPVSLNIDQSGHEVVTIGYKYTTHADHEQNFQVRTSAEIGSWVKWIIHVKTGLQGGGKLSSTTYGENGRVEVWRQGAGDSNYVKVVDYTGDVGYEDFRNNLRLQLGIYSQGTNGAPSYDDGSDSERTLRYRNFYSGIAPLM